MGKFWQSPGGGALISGVGSFGSGLFGGLFSKASQKRQYKYNLKLQQQQQDWQRLMWLRENEYNLPINEVRRLTDAGINPALAFSNGGASAAPVPVSGSSGGVSAPTAVMPNVGAAAVLTAQSQQRLQNETEVAQSQVNLNNAKAEEARNAAGLSSSIKDWNEFNLGVRKEVRDILVSRPRLDYQFRQLDYALGYEEYTRSQILTSNFPTLQNQQIQINNLQIDNLRHTGNKILAEIGHLVALGDLTTQEAKIARERLAVVSLDAMMARVSKRAYEDVFATQYKRADGSWGQYWEKLSDVIRNRISEQLQRSETGLIESGLDYDFQMEFGSSLREYNFETVKRGANKLRTDQYTSVINSFVGVGTAAISASTAAASNSVRRSLVRNWQSVGRQMGSTLPYGSFGDATVPSYHGGTDYYPLYDF